MVGNRGTGVLEKGPGEVQEKSVQELRFLRSVKMAGERGESENKFIPLCNILQ